MIKYLRFTKKVAKSGKAFLVWIPKDVSDFLDIAPEELLEFKIRKLELKTFQRSQEMQFLKKASKSKQGYLVWLPKDVVEYLSIDERSFIEIALSKLPQKEAIAATQK